MAEGVNLPMPASAVILEGGLAIDVRLPPAMEVVELVLVVPQIIALVPLQDGMELTAKFPCVVHLARILAPVPV